MNFLVRMLLSAVAVLIVSYLLPGVDVDSFLTAFILAVVLTLLNYVVKPILVVFTIPLTVLTLGLFLLVINAAIILLADSIIGGFRVDGFWWALLFSLLLSLTNSLLADLSGQDNPRR
jgi:putative membrane protein